MIINIYNSKYKIYNIIKNESLNDMIKLINYNRFYKLRKRPKNNNYIKYKFIKKICIKKKKKK